VKISSSFVEAWRMLVHSPPQKLLNLKVYKGIYLKVYKGAIIVIMDWYQTDEYAGTQLKT
jgi:hypothetical protein